MSITGTCPGFRISSFFTGGGPSGREADFGAQGGDGGVVSFGTGAGAAGGVVDDAGGIFPVHGVNVVGVFFLLVCQGKGTVQGQFGAGHFCFSCLFQQPFVAGRCAVAVEPGGHMADAAGEDGLIDACFIGPCGEAADGCVPFPGGGGAVEEEFFPGDGQAGEVLIEYPVFRIFLGRIEVEDVVVGYHVEPVVVVHRISVAVFLPYDGAVGRHVVVGGAVEGVVFVEVVAPFAAHGQEGGEIVVPLGCHGHDGHAAHGLAAAVDAVGIDVVLAGEVVHELPDGGFGAAQGPVVPGHAEFIVGVGFVHSVKFGNGGAYYDDAVQTVFSGEVLEIFRSVVGGGLGFGEGEAGVGAHGAGVMNVKEKAVGFMGVIVFWHVEGVGQVQVPVLAISFVEAVDGMEGGAVFQCMELVFFDAPDMVGAFFGVVVIFRRPGLSGLGVIAYVGFFRVVGDSFIGWEDDAFFRPDGFLLGYAGIHGNGVGPGEPSGLVVRIHFDDDIRARGGAAFGVHFRLVIDVDFFDLTGGFSLGQVFLAKGGAVIINGVGVCIHR